MRENQTKKKIFSAKRVVLLKKHVRLIVPRNQVPFTTKHFVQIEINRNSHVNARHRLVITNGSNHNGVNARQNAAKECKVDKLCAANSMEIRF